MAKRKIQVNEIEISIVQKNKTDYICITDIARQFSDSPGDVIKNYLRNGQNLEYMAAWEELHNPDFKTVVADRFRADSIKNSFTLSVGKWVKETNSKGIYSVKGKYGGTYAQKDIAYQFAMWLSPVFQLYIVKEFDRLKQEEEATQTFYLQKIFGDSLQINRFTQQLLEERGVLPPDSGK